MGTKGYEIRRLEQQVRQVESEQKNLQIKASDLQSIDRIQTNAQSLNFVPATNITYLKDSDFALKWRDPNDPNLHPNYPNQGLGYSWHSDVIRRLGSLNLWTVKL